MGGYLPSAALARSGDHWRLPGDGPPDRCLARGLTCKGRLELPQMGAGSTNEKRVLIVFGLTALAWIMRGEPFGGWSTWFGLPDANDAMVAFLGVIALFLILYGQVVCLLDWDTASNVPWGFCSCSVLASRLPVPFPPVVRLRKGWHSTSSASLPSVWFVV